MKNHYAGWLFPPFSESECTKTCTVNRSICDSENLLLSLCAARRLFEMEFMVDIAASTWTSFAQLVKVTWLEAALKEICQRRRGYFAFWSSIQDPQRVASSFFSVYLQSQLQMCLLYHSLPLPSNYHLLTGFSTLATLWTHNRRAPLSLILRDRSDMRGKRKSHKTPLFYVVVAVPD